MSSPFPLRIGYVLDYVCHAGSLPKGPRDQKCISAHSAARGLSRIRVVKMHVATSSSQLLTRNTDTDFLTIDSHGRVLPVDEGRGVGGLDKGVGMVVVRRGEGGGGIVVFKVIQRTSDQRELKAASYNHFGSSILLVCLCTCLLVFVQGSCTGP